MSKDTAKRQKVAEALSGSPGSTVSEVADAVGIGRSTAHQYLAALIDDGKVQRNVGGRDGGRRLPDHYSLVASEATSAEGEKPASKPKPAAASTVARLRPGELDGLVLGFMREHPDDGPFSAGAVARGIDRSAGAVRNCLDRLAEREEASRVSTKPNRYAVKA